MGETMLEVKNLSVTYYNNSEFKVRDVDFYVKKGEVLGVIGRNGAGKTTVMKSIVGLKGIDGGKVLIDGCELWTDNKKIKDMTGYITSDWIYNVKMRTDLQAKCLGAWYSDFSYSKYKGICKRLGIKEKAKPLSMSAGEKVKFSLAFALSHNVKLLIMDEPLSNLDPVSREEVMELLRDVIEKGDVSIVFSTHLVHELEKIADRIIYMDNGSQKLFMDMNDIQDKYFKDRIVNLEELFEYEELNEEG